METNNNDGMKIIKNDGYGRCVGFKWGIIKYWKILTRNPRTEALYCLTLNFGVMDRCLPICVRRVYRSTRKPRFRNLPLLHLVLFPVFMCILLYFILLALFDLLGKYVFYHIYDELITMPLDRKKLIYGVSWTVIALIFIILSM